MASEAAAHSMAAPISGYCPPYHRARSGVDASYEDLGPDMSKADASQRAMRLLDAVHSSLSSSQLLSSKAGQEEHEMSHSQRPPIDVDALCQQVLVELPEAVWLRKRCACRGWVVTQEHGAPIDNLNSKPKDG
eukprot:1141273-Pelagomonas_calceolata.AAC.4